jgi:L-aspartate semialdehyde sulfurtransferase ferredoxin
MPLPKKSASPPKSKKRTTVRKAARPVPQQHSRLWLMYPSKLITHPIIHDLGQKFKVIPNVRQASVTEEIGIVCLELTGSRQQIKASIQWMEKQGISVEPVEINVIGS